MGVAENIRDQLVSTMREELHNCPDPLVYCANPELEDIDVSWDENTPHGLRLTTDQGVFEVTVSVVKV